MYDIIGVGIGPMNLGLSALSHPTELKTAFFDERQQFSWHPGMMIRDTMMQTSFISDLVTLADPTSTFTYLNFLHSEGRLHAFYFYEKLLISRREYNAYLTWVTKQLSDLHFRSRVVDVFDTGDSYEVVVESTASGERTTYETKHLVIGTGSVPSIPETFEDVLHNTEYLTNKPELLKRDRITIIGSGQSAAEIFLDLLVEQKTAPFELEWIARSTLFETLETGKLGEEIFSPNYVEYFNRLPLDVRKDSVSDFARSQNGISPETLQTIYEQLYNLDPEQQERIKIRTNLEVNAVHKRKGYEIEVTHTQLGDRRVLHTDAVIAATGFKPALPSFTQHLDIVFETDTGWKVNDAYRIERKKGGSHHLYATANLELSHGPAADNLGMSVSRNQAILNDVAQKELYPIERRATFTIFD